MNKVLVRLYVPSMEKEYNIWIPLNKKIYTVTTLIAKGIREMTDGIYDPKKLPILYNRETGVNYKLDDVVKDTDIVNGSELIFI